MPNPSDELKDRLEYLEFAVREQISRLYRIEKHLGIAEEEAKVPPQAGVIPEYTLQSPLDAPIPQIQAPVSAQPAILEKESLAEAPSTPQRSLEQRIGGSWFSRIGIFAIVLAVGFFIKYAFEREWIGPGQRVLGGLAAGLGLLVFGERLREKGMRAYAQVISGGGIAILFLSIYAAYDFYELIPGPIAFAAMAAIAALAAGLAVRQNAQSLATLGTLGAFLTPVLLSTGQDSRVAFYLYMIVVNLGILAIAYYKRWRLQEAIAFTATTILSYIWIWDHFHETGFFSMFAFSGILFLIFAILPLVHLRRDVRGRWTDILLIVLNAVAGLFTAMTISRRHDEYFGLESVVLSIVHAGLAYRAFRYEQSERHFVWRAYAAMSLLLLTIAIPFQFDNQIVTILFALEAALLFWTGIRYSILLARIASALILVVAALHWLNVDVANTGNEMVRTQLFKVLSNGQVAGCIALIACLIFASWMYRTAPASAPSLEKNTFAQACTIGALLLGLTLLSMETYDFYQARILAVGAEWGTPGYTPENIEAQDELRLAQQLALSILWGLYGAGLLAFGILRSIRPLRIVALALLVVTTLKVFLIDLQELDRIYRIISFFALGAILLVISYFYQRSLRRGAAQ